MKKCYNLLRYGCGEGFLRISWTERKTNKWVRERIGVKEEDGIVKQIKGRKLAKYVH